VITYAYHSDQGFSNCGSLPRSEFRTSVSLSTNKTWPLACMTILLALTSDLFETKHYFPTEIRDTEHTINKKVLSCSCKKSVHLNVISSWVAKSLSFWLSGSPLKKGLRTSDLDSKQFSHFGACFRWDLKSTLRVTTTVELRLASPAVFLATTRAVPASYSRAFVISRICIIPSYRTRTRELYNLHTSENQ